MEWRALFGSPQILVTDMGSYFTSDVMKQYVQICNVKHHLTVAYGHYNNGSIEVMIVVDQSIIIRVEMG